MTTLISGDFSDGDFLFRFPFPIVELCMVAHSPIPSEEKSILHSIRLFIATLRYVPKNEAFI
jgi:hypothetical protein